MKSVQGLGKKSEKCPNRQTESILAIKWWSLNYTQFSWRSQSNSVILLYCPCLSPKSCCKSFSGHVTCGVRLYHCTSFVPRACFDHMIVANNWRKVICLSASWAFFMCLCSSLFDSPGQCLGVTHLTVMLQGCLFSECIRLPSVTVSQKQEPASKAVQGTGFMFFQLL